MDNEYLVETHIKPSANTNLVRLGPVEKIMLVLNTLFNSEEQELEATERTTSKDLQTKAELNMVIERGIKDMRLNHKNKVTLQVASEFLPYIDDVMDPVYGYGKYYNYKVFSRDLPLEINFFFYVVIWMKEV